MMLGKNDDDDNVQVLGEREGNFKFSHYAKPNEIGKNSKKEKKPIGRPTVFVYSSQGNRHDEDNE